MKINVAQLLKEPVGSTRSYKVDEISEAEGGKCVITGDLQLIRYNRGLLVIAKLKARVTLICSRCLCTFDYPLLLTIEEEAFPTIDINTGLPLPSLEGPNSFVIDTSHILDLDELIRQYILLAQPMKPLCRPGCAGLCPSCGRNLNQGLCQCPSLTRDQRWSELLGLKKGIK